MLRLVDRERFRRCRVRRPDRRRPSRSPAPAVRCGWARRRKPCSCSCAQTAIPDRHWRAASRTLKRAAGVGVEIVEGNRCGPVVAKAAPAVWTMTSGRTRFRPARGRPSRSRISSSWCTKPGAREPAAADSSEYHPMARRTRRAGYCPRHAPMAPSSRAKYSQTAEPIKPDVKPVTRSVLPMSDAAREGQKAFDQMRLEEVFPAAKKIYPAGEDQQSRRSRGAEPEGEGEIFRPVAEAHAMHAGTFEVDALEGMVHPEVGRRLPRPPRLQNHFYSRFPTARPRPGRSWQP